MATPYAWDYVGSYKSNDNPSIRHLFSHAVVARVRLVIKQFDPDQKETFTFKVWFGTEKDVTTFWSTNIPFEISETEQQSLLNQVYDLVDILFN